MFLLFISLFLNLHPFHVSVCDVNYNAKTKSAEMTLKIFLDDLETTLRKAHNSKVDILKLTDKERDVMVKAYIQKNFAVVFDNYSKDYDFLGTEIEKDALWCYLEKKGLKKISKVWVESTLLQETFEDQVNLINVSKGGQTKSTRLDSSKPFDIIAF